MSRPPLIPLNRTLLTNELTHIDLPKYITEPSSNLQLSSTRGSSSFINPPSTHNYPPVRGSDKVHQLNNKQQSAYNGQRKNYPNSGENNSRATSSGRRERKHSHEPTYSSSSSNRVNQNQGHHQRVNHHNRNSPRSRNKNASNKLRTPLPQAAPPLEKIGYDYDYEGDSDDYDSTNDPHSVPSKYTSSESGGDGKVLLSPKISMYKNKVDQQGDLRSSRSSHRSENWAPPVNGRSIRYNSSPHHKRTSESTRLNNYSRRGQSYPNQQYPSSSAAGGEYYYPEAYDDYNHHQHQPTHQNDDQHHHSHHHNYHDQNNHGHNLTPSRPDKSTKYHSPVSNDDYPVDTYDTMPHKSAHDTTSPYTDTGGDQVPSLDSFYDKDLPDDTGDGETDDTGVDDGETGEVSEMDPESTLNDDTNDNGHGEETLDDDDTKEVRSQTLYASGSDEIPNDMRLPYHNAPIDDREIASDSFLTSREFAADSLVDSAKQQPTANK